MGLLVSVSAVLLAPSFAAQGLVFDNRVVTTGTSNVSFGRGSAMVDLDQDGLLDLVCSDASQVNHFFRQLPGEVFIDANTIWGVPTTVDYAWGVLAADFDNDGDDDVYFGSGGSAGGDLPGVIFPNTMLRNDIGSLGVLTDVSSATGAAINSVETFGVTALDFDRDGMLDIFCSDRNESCKLFRNDGGLFFEDVSSQAGISGLGTWKHCGSADYDNDGWPDVGVGSGSAQNQLWHNEQNGTFTNQANSAGIENPVDNFGIVFQDYDNDGWVDIYIPKYQLTPTGPSPVYLNNGNGTFTDVSPGTGMGSHTDMGHESADLDADGYPEIMMGTGHPLTSFLDYLYKVTPAGPGALNINDISTGSRFNSAGLSRQHGQAVGDFDRDGDIDVYCNNGGPDNRPTTAQDNYFWQNRGNSNNWTAIEIEGIWSNRTGVGTVAKATTLEGRDVYRSLQVGRGFGNTPDHALHFGLGTDTGVSRIELRWPSGIVQAIDEPDLSTYAPVVETGAILRGTPTIGQSFGIDFAGRLGDVVELAFSSATASIELDGFNGTFELADPYSVLPAIPLNGSGKLSLSFPVPNSPGLIGLTIYSQAWIHAPADLGTLSQLFTLTIQ